MKGKIALKWISPAEFETTHSESVSALSDTSGLVNAVLQRQTLQGSVSQCQ